MSVESLLTFLTQIIFLLVAGSTLFNWAKYRTRARFDIALVFLSLAVAIIAQELQRLFPALAPALTLIFLVALLAQPHLLLRLVEYFRPVPSFIQRTALVGLLLIIALFSFSQTAPMLGLILATVYFIVMEGYAAILLVQGARTLRGVLGKRLQLASIGSGLLALIFSLSLAFALIRSMINLPPTSQSWAGPIFQTLAILSGLCYYFGFSPPSWIRQNWQFRELYYFLQHTSKQPERDRLADFEELADAALRTVGGTTAIVAGWDAVEKRLIIEIPGKFPWQADSLENEAGAIGKAWQEKRVRLARVPHETGPGTNQWANQFGARTLFIAPILGSLQPWGMLIVALRYEPLFDQDDLDLLTLLARETAVSLDKFALIHELQITNQSLGQRVEERTAQLQAEILERERTEQVLRGTENRFRSIVEAATIAMISVGREGKINLVNTRAQELFGYSQEELLGHPVEILVPERFRGQHTLERQGFLNRPSSRPMGVGRDLFGLHKDGYEIPIEIGLSPYESAEGLSILALIVDISERKEAQAQNTYHARLLRHINDAVIATDPNFLITAWNRAAERTYGWTAEEVMGRNAAEMMRSGLTDEQRTEATERLSQESAARSETIHYRKDGQPIYVEANMIALTDEYGKMTGYVSVNRDITERKQAEEKLHRQNQRLKILREIDTAILSSDSIENIVGAALSHIRELIECRRASVTLFDWDKQEAMLFAVQTAGETSNPKGMRVPLAPYQEMIAIFLKNEPLVINDLSMVTDPPPALQNTIQAGFCSLCSLPLFSQSSLIGTFGMASETPGFFDEDQINLGREVANQVAIAITQNNLFKELRKLNAELEQRVMERTAQLQESEEKFSKAFLASPAAMSIAQASDGRYMDVNESMAEMTGYSREELIGHTPLELGLVDAEARAKIMQAAQENGFVRDVEIQVHTRSNQILDVLVSLEQIVLNGQTCMLTIQYNITKRKHAEAEVRRLNQELEQRRIALEATNKELEAFSYSVSHDLRAPLRAINGFSQALSNKHKDSLGEQGRHYLSRIQANTHHMGELIDDLLSLSRISRREMKQDEVNLTELARQIDKELRAQEPERQVLFEAEGQLKVRGDVGLIRIVLQNLLTNAWKFTSTRPQAHIQFGILGPSSPAAGHSAENVGEKVYYVQDNGVGFDIVFANKLFGAFQRLHSTAEFPGTGIGLAIVQRCIHRHGGRIWAEAELEKGATFYFTLGESHES